MTTVGMEEDMKVRIDKCSCAKTGDPKHHRITGDIRELVQGEVALLKNTDGSTKFRRTSYVQKTEIFDNKIVIHTENTLYDLTIVEI